LKKIVIALLIIGVGITLGCGLGYLIRKRATHTPPPSSENEDKEDESVGFVWGVSDAMYQVDGYSPSIGARQIGYINELGVNTVRVNLERTVQLNPLKFTFDEQANDDFINQLSQNGKDICLIIDGDIINSLKIEGFNYERAGFELGSYAAKRYKGKVKYIQTANEVSGTIVKPSDPDFKGETFNDGDYDIKYSVDRYKATLGWVKGMSKGIRNSAPKIKIVLSGHWILYDVINRLQADGVDFDILGWAFYSTDGTDITKRDIGDGKSIDLAAELSKIGKPIWIIESNADKGSLKGERPQADFIKNFISNLPKAVSIKGFFVYTLFDDPGPSGYTDLDNTHWGLIEVKVDANGQPQFRKKLAFYTYKDMIASSSE